MPVKQSIMDAHLPPVADGWRIMVHDQLKPVLKVLFAVARKETLVRLRGETVVAYVRLYRGTSKHNRKLQREEIIVGPPLQPFMRELQQMFAAVVEPDGTPRRGFTVRVEVFPDWQRWVVYVRDVPK